MKICVLGKGFIADHLAYDKPNVYLKPTINNIEYFVDNYRPDVIISCIGKTGNPNIDWCEKNKEETLLGNVTVPVLLAEVCSKRSIHLIQINSGCIFYGSSPHVDKSLLTQEVIYDYGWKENDLANPKSFYSKTKYSCDLMIGDMPNVTILRIRMPLSEKNHPRNLINKLKNYEKIINIKNSVTFTKDLVRCIDHIIKERCFGIFHVTSPDPLTAVEIMEEYRKHIPYHQFEVISEAELSKLTLAARSNCILDCSKLENIGFLMTPTQEALQQCMANYINNIGIRRF
jgi:dTDP-4-dehydrorhamnose reductase